MQRWVVACSLALLLCAVFADECPDGGHCKDGDTCCRHPSNGYECCPFDQAECCGDHVHCCPAGMTCDVDRSRCVNVTATVPWTTRTPTEQPRLSRSFRMIKSYVGDDDDNICPDQSRCPAEFSCLRALTKYGCCPLAQGIPCSDGKHCCPQSHSCTADSRSCVKKDVTSTVLCNDGVSECPEESSCCEGRDGQFGCCPMPKSVCCDDKVHCCPEGSQCDLETYKCISISSKKQLPMWAKFPARRRAEWEDQKEEQLVTSEAATGSESEEGKAEQTDAVASPGERASYVSCDSTTRCPGAFTCCRDLARRWRCCPYTLAVCCSDGYSSCPYGMVCDVTHRMCMGSYDSRPMIWCSPAFITAAPSTTGETQYTGSGQSEEAESEEDEDDEDVEHRVPYAVVSPGERASDDPCNSTTACPEGTTCCPIQSGVYACCGLPNAVCCSDHLHCCPHGKVCDVEHQRCADPSDAQTTPMFQSTPSFTTAALSTTAEIQYTGSDQSEEAESEEDEEDEEDEDDEDMEHRVPCKGHKNGTCHRNSTCCYSQRHKRHCCCPLPNATCCHEGRHCCPHGFQCREENNGCVKDGVEIPWYAKVPALPRLQEPLSDAGVSSGERASDVQCNSTAYCPDGTTCCTNPQREWGCCPAPNAMCCSDHIHCCPQGTVCDVEHQRCADPSDARTTPMIQRSPAFTTTAPSAIAGIQYTGSDQSEEAESEEDEEDEDDEDVEHRVPYAVVSPGERASDVQCNSTETCPDGTTCCTAQSGEWACCGLPNAVCCSDHMTCCPNGMVCCDDHLHCCPQGTVCDLAQQTCTSSSDARTTPMFQRRAASTTAATSTTAEIQHTGSSQSEEDEEEEEDEDVEHKFPYGVVSPGERASDVQCNSTAYCPDGSTCCTAQSGEWACCDIPNAVCCSDHTYCCPNGMVCCNDHLHCCPQGTVCDLAQQMCTSSTDARTTPMFQRSAASTIAATSTTAEIQYTESSQSEEGESEEDEDDEDDEDDKDDEDVEDWVRCKGHKRAACHRNSTCCHSRGHKRHCCCPLHKATCCNDSRHCCPEGYRCCPRRKTCVKDSVEIPWYTNLPALPNPKLQQTESQFVETIVIEWRESDDDEEDGDDDGDDDDTTEEIQENTAAKATMDENEQTKSEDDDESEDDDDDDDTDEDDEDDVVHCDEKTSCPKGSSCCKTDDRWGCCPLRHAVCCSDGEHCCPVRHHCSKTHKTCVRDDNVVIPWYTKLPALSSPETGSDKLIKCSDGHSCPKSNTCCQLSSGEYGCCPVENAVCCSDKKHCCPSDYACNPSAANCQRSVVLEVEFVPLTPAISETGKRCGRDICDDTQKCCMNRGMPHCCQYKDGVCCDTRTCCRAGEQCTPTGGCTSTSGSTWDDWLRFFKRDEENPEVL